VGSANKAVPIAESASKQQLLADFPESISARKGPSGFGKFITHVVSTRPRCERFNIEFIPRQLILDQRMLQRYPQPSANFREPAALDWLHAISESNGILSAILVVIHPKLYDAGWKATKYLGNTPETGTKELLDGWASVFSGVSVISNCITMLHWDVNSRANWYDILLTLGPYENCDLKLPGLGISLEYGPGTVVGILGKVLEHAVPSFKGDRVCYAYFMRNNVHEWAKIAGKDWMETSYYK